MPTWNSTASGIWNVGSNWTGGAAPNGTAHVATFNNATNGGFQQIGILEDTTMTIGQLNVNLTGTSDLSIGGSFADSGASFGTLYFNNGSTLGAAVVSINTAVGGGEFEITGIGGLRVDLGNFRTDFDVVNAGTTARLNAQIVGSGTLAKFGDGTLVVGNNNATWTGGITVNDGILQAGGGALGSGNVFLQTGGTLRASGTVTNLIGVATTGGSITAAAGGTATLNGYFSVGTTTLGGQVTFGSATDTGTIIANFSGTEVSTNSSFNIAGGTLRLENSAVATALLQTPGTGLTGIASGATLDTRGFDTVITNLDLNGGTIRTSTGVMDLNIDDNTAGTTSQSGTIEGTAGTDSVRVDVNAGFSFAGVNFTNWTDGTDTITIVGNAGINGIVGSTHRDFIDGGDGNDVIFGNGGLDQIGGGTGDDLIILNGANSGTRVYGGDGTDTLRIISGSVQLDRNYFNTGFEKIELTGGATLDLTTYQYNTTFADGTTIAGNGTLEIDMGFNDTFNGTHMAVATGSSISTLINGYDFSGGSDIVKGMNGATNTIYGNAGVDKLIGGNLGDIINGGSETDKIRGDGGADVLTGGSGADVFKFRNASDSGLGANADIITDFVSGTDKLNFLRIDADANTAGDQAFNFVGTGAFTGGGLGSIRYVDTGSDIRVEVDVDGNGVADMHVMLQGAGLGAGTLTAADFVL